MIAGAQPETLDGTPPERGHEPGVPVVSGSELAVSAPGLLGIWRPGPQTGQPANGGRSTVHVPQGREASAAGDAASASSAAVRPTMPVAAANAIRTQKYRM